MAAKIVSLADRRPPQRPVICETSAAIDGLMWQVANASDPVLAALWMTSVFTGCLRGWGVPAADVAALASGDADLETLAQRYAGLLERQAEEELAQGDGPGA